MIIEVVSVGRPGWSRTRKAWTDVVWTELENWKQCRTWLQRYRAWPNLPRSCCRNEVRGLDVTTIGCSGYPWGVRLMYKDSLTRHCANYKESSSGGGVQLRNSNRSSSTASSSEREDREERDLCLSEPAHTEQNSCSRILSSENTPAWSCSSTTTTNCDPGYADTHAPGRIYIRLWQRAHHQPNGHTIIIVIVHLD